MKFSLLGLFAIAIIMTFGFMMVAPLIRRTTDEIPDASDNGHPLYPRCRVHDGIAVRTNR